MELVIPSKHIPMFHRVIQCLAKIGEDIRFQIPNDKAVRDSRDILASSCIIAMMCILIVGVGDGNDARSSCSKPSIRPSQ